MNYYEILALLRAELVDLGRVNVISASPLNEGYLARTDIYPLCHIQAQPAVRNERTTTWVFNVVIADIIDFNLEEIREQDEAFYQTSNEQDVIAESFLAAERLIDRLTRGDAARAANAKAQVGSSIAPFSDRYNNKLAGVEFTMNIDTPNSSVANGKC